MNDSGRREKTPSRLNGRWLLYKDSAMVLEKQYTYSKDSVSRNPTSTIATSSLSSRRQIYTCHSLCSIANYEATKQVVVLIYISLDDQNMMNALSQSVDDFTECWATNGDCVGNKCAHQTRCTCQIQPQDSSPPFLWTLHCVVRV